ncbi:hypothetical protein ACF09J_05045 [Streptomyces sp. NPDC014889]|uniref:hypothetical protein n=1 Tax=Streptomyces sp. NPDC014889 TaxID=3364928 RepID=UPI0037007A9F
MATWILTGALALLVAAIQTYWKWVTRKTASSHGLKKDDWVFYIDWTVTSAVALCYSLIDASLKHKPVEPMTVSIALIVGILGVGMLPNFVRDLCYDASGNIKGWKHIVGLDLAGMAFLFSSVVAGVKTYGA